jgi:hypothetical protein
VDATPLSFRRSAFAQSCAVLRSNHSDRILSRATSGGGQARPLHLTFDLRAELLHADPLASMLSDLLVVVVFNLVIWGGGFVLFEAMMARAKSTGKLGLY